MPTHHIPRPQERPDVEVLVDNTWCPGEIRMQTQLDDGTWQLEVQYRAPGEHSSRIDTFTPDQVREDQNEVSPGRAGPVESARR